MLGRDLPLVPPSTQWECSSLWMLLPVLLCPAVICRACRVCLVPAECRACRVCLVRAECRACQACPVPEDCRVCQACPVLVASTSGRACRLLVVCRVSPACLVPAASTSGRVHACLVPVLCRAERRWRRFVSSLRSYPAGGKKYCSCPCPAQTWRHHGKSCQRR